MDGASYISLSLATAMRRDLDVTANNIANANTAGFKGERVAFEAYVAATPGGEETEFVLDVGSYVDLTQGALTQTGNPLDVALNGKGWLSYETTEGQVGYGRDGRLIVGPEGTLQTVSGARVLDSGGGPITLPPDPGTITITTDGTIATEQGPVGQIGVFDLPDVQSYERIGQGMFVPPEGAADTAVEAEATEVIQGSIEGSNIQPVSEVTRLLDVQKAYERAHKIIETEDRLLRDALRRLGRMS